MAAQPNLELRETLGGVRGRVLSIADRGQAMIIVEDEVYRRPVVCYVTDEQLAEQDDTLIGKRALIEGRISRESASGTPVAVREVRGITILPEPDPDIWRKTRGILRPPADGSLPEERTRRMRDEM